MRLPIIENLAEMGHGLGLENGPRSIGAVRVLRISVTDRCNLRCLYCMPEEGVTWLPKGHILAFEEIEEVVRAAIELHGIRRFKLTGGEPTVRHGIVELVRRLRTLPGLEDLSLTSNGILLADLARPLKDAGLDRITISIDSLRPERFRAVTKTGELAAVMAGLDAAERAGFASIKLNVVTMRGTNEDEVADFARLTLDRGVTIRFIEYMPLGDAALLATTAFEEQVREDGRVTFKAAGRVDEQEIGPAGGCGAQDRGNCFIAETEVRERIERELGPLVPVDRETEAGVGPAVPYRLARGNPKGRVGFISAMSEPFCSTCNRLRLTADGVLRSCLFEGGEVDTRPILRGGLVGEDLRKALAAAMTDCVRLKPVVHSGHGNQHMSRIGG